MSLSCEIDVCKRKYCILCYCCNKKKLCFNHGKEHRDVIQSELNSIANEINVINDQLMILSEGILVDPSLDKYILSRIEYLKKIVGQLRSTISELNSQQDTTNDDISLLTSAINCIKQEIERIKQTIIADNLLSGIIERIKPIEPSKFDFSSLSSPFQTIVCQHSLGSALASNDQQLLMDQRLNLHLFNRDLILKKQYQWENGLVRSICWSSTLKKFVFVTNNQEIYLVDDHLTSIECLFMVEEHDWSSSTCSDTSLFLTTNHRGSQIFEFSLSTNFQLIQQWTSPHSCQEHQCIRDILYNNQTLALIIEDSLSNMAHLELRSSETLVRLWSFRSDIQYHLFQPAIRCCSLKYDQWLIIDSNNSRLIHIDQHGQMKGLHVYKSPPWNAVLHHSNILAIRTENNLNFHRIY